MTFFAITCSTKFLREFNFANGRFLYFAGTNFCDWEKLVFLARNQSFSIFRKSLLFGIMTFSFFDLKQSNTGEQRTDI